LGPSVGVLVGVLATQAPEPVQAESKRAVQPLGHDELLGTEQVLPSHSQQSFGPSVGVGVGVFGTHPSAATQAELKATSQPVGQVPPEGTEQTVPSHWQQSFGPGVGGTIVHGSASASTSAAEMKPSQFASAFSGLQSGQRLQSKTRLIITGTSSSLMTPSQLTSPGKAGELTVPHEGSVPQGALPCANTYWG
jgi:hypothetical protein